MSINLLFAGLCWWMWRHWIRCEGIGALCVCLCVCINSNVTLCSLYTMHRFVLVISTLPVEPVYEGNL